MNGGKRVYILFVLCRFLVGKLTAANAVYGPFVNDLAIHNALEQHPVRVERQERVGFPYKFELGNRFKNLYNGNICHMPLACSGQTSIKSYPVLVNVRAALCKNLCSTVGAHCVAARRAKPYPEE